MNPPYFDIHTHRCGPEADVRKVCVYLLGRGNPLPEGGFTAGVHPWDVKKADFSELDFFAENHPGLLGIGEIGLDFAVKDADRALQSEWLNRQLAIAERMNLPVVLHCVKAYNEIQTELKKYRLKAVVFHGFTGSPELAGQLLKQGYYLSFGEFSLHSPKTVDALKTAPLERIFLETDDDPGADIRMIYGKTAVIREITLEELKDSILNNYEKVFHG